MAPAATTTVKALRRDIPFTWEGKDKRGTRVKGKSLAPDETSLRADLRRQGIAPSQDGNAHDRQALLRGVVV